MRFFWPFVTLFLMSNSLLRVNPSSLSGRISIPPSKSHTLRAVLFASLGNGVSRVYNYLDSPDTQAMLTACRLLGARIVATPECLEITGIDGKVEKAEDVIQAGNSGIVLRFICAISALSSYPIVMTGDYSIRHQRPMAALLSGLNQLGAHAISTKNDGFAPIIVQGPLKGGRAVINGADSQPISALLIAGSLSKEPIELIVENPGEKPWITFTLKWLERLGIHVEHEDFRHYFIKGGSIQAFDYSVPGDFSTAAFPVAAALITQSEILIENLDMNDFQGDKELIAIFKKMGAKIKESVEGLVVQPSGLLEGLDIDVNDFIDGLPILAVLGCYANGKTVLRNAKIAREKECDRISCVARELKKMGAKIEECEDGLIIERADLKGSFVDGCFDHRLSMALSVAALGCHGESTISSAESIKKTYPDFLKDFQQLKANILPV